MSPSPAAAGSDFVDYPAEFCKADFVFAAASLLNLSSNTKTGRVYFREL